MKNEKILEFIAAFENALNQRDADFFRSCLDGIKKGAYKPEDLNGCTDSGRVLARFAGAVWLEMIDDGAKSAGKAAIKKALEKVCKASKNTYREYLSRAAVVDDKMIVCDGYELFRVQPVELAPEYMPEGERGAAELEKLVYRVLTPEQIENKKTRLTVPGAAALKAFIKEGKAARKLHNDKTPLYYDFGAGLPAVNAEKLQDILTIYGDGVELYAGSAYEAVYIKSDAGDGIIMPVKKTA